MTLDEIESNLLQFTGTEHWYQHPLFRRYLFTDGVRYVAENCGAFWLMDAIFACQLEPKVKREEFQVWVLKVKDRSAVLTCDNGNGNIVYQQEIPFTDFPLAEITMYFENSTLCLPAER
ncbi:MAG: DUF6876 family protein [Candidatus Competibacter sp.]